HHSRTTPMSTITTEQPGRPVIPEAKERLLVRLSRRESSLAWIFLAPALIILVVFMAYPFASGIYISMTDAMVGFAAKNFVWFENHQRLLDDPRCPKTHRRTFICGAGTVPLKLGLGLWLALVLSQPSRFSRVYPALLRPQWIVPPAISSLAFLMLHNGAL